MDLPDLPELVWIQIAMKLNYDDSLILCSVDPQLDQMICQNESFWQQRYLQDFPPPKSTPSSWKKLYQEARSGQVWGFGNNNKGQLGLGFLSDRFGVKVPQPLFIEKPIKSVAAGRIHSLFLDISGQVWASGANYYGELGFDSGEEEELSPRLIEELTNIQMISAGSDFSLCLDHQGGVWAFGENDYGQLGIGKVDPYHHPDPKLIPNLPPIKEISTGEKHCLLLDELGQVWVFGRNDYGQLGTGHTSRSKNTPQIILGLPTIRSISAGDNHSLCLDFEGNVWGFGWNEFGQLGFENHEEEDEEEDEEDEEEGYGPILIPIQIPNLKDIQMISAGGDHSVCLDQHGLVYSFGHYSYLTITQFTPQVMSTLPPIKFICAGETSDLFIDQDGHVWGFGKNMSEFNEDLNQVIPIKIPYPFSVKELSIYGDFNSGDHALIICPYHLTPFHVIERLIKDGQIKNYHVRDDLGVPSPNVILEMVELDNRAYLFLCQYDPQNEMIYPPVLASE